MERPRKYFVARHDLTSFQNWPGAIWRTGETEFPRGLKKMQVGDCWVAFAYIDSERQNEPVRQIVGFYKCTAVHNERRVQIPRSARNLNRKVKYAWAIEGESLGRELAFPVTVPSINQMLRTRKYGGQTLTPLNENEFFAIKEIVEGKRALSPENIPVVGRDPRNEQEVVAILVAAHKKLGIEYIDRIRTGFPDFRVKLKGRKDLVHIEVETYSSSFLLHKHEEQVWAKKLKSDSPEERLPVILVCWYRNDLKNSVRRHVHKIFDLCDLLQHGGKITY